MQILFRNKDAEDYAHVLKEYRSPICYEKIIYYKIIG